MPNSFDSADQSIYNVPTRAAGPAGSLPLDAEFLRNRPSGDFFGWSQNAGMGWNPATLGGKEFLIHSTHGGIRAPNGTPIALGCHTGHWAVGDLMEAAAMGSKAAGAVPLAPSAPSACNRREQQ